MTQLRPEHLAHLRESGLTDETIAVAGIRSVDTDEIAIILKWRSKNYSFGPGIVFPYFKADGTCNGYERVRLDFPRQHQDGKSVRYESPKSSLNRPYFGPRFVATMTQDATIYFTEGEKKTLALDQLGLATIGLPGVWGFMKRRPTNQSGIKYGKVRLHPDLAEIEWKNRRVFVVFDSDASEKRQVQQAEFRLAELLKASGADVRIARLPQVGSGKTGVDDFLVHYGEDGPKKFEAVIQKAEPAEEPEALSPIDIAKELIADQFTALGCKALVFHNSEYFRWMGNCYASVHRDELVPRVQDWLANHGHRASSTFAREITNSLQALTVQDFSKAPPFYLSWAAPDHRFAPAETLVGRNMMLSLTSLESDASIFRDPYPGFFNVNGLDYNIDLQAPKPTQFCEFLKSLWPDDAASIQTLLEWLGYLLTPETSQQKILLVVGPKRSGKGTLARVIRGLVGDANVVSPTLASLATNFGLAPLINKTVAIVSDARLSGRVDHSIVTERLLSISGEDSLTIDRKHLSAVDFRLKTRFNIFTNELPRVGDASGALASRMIILRLRNSFYGREDLTLTNRLLSERGGILLLAIDGWKRLRKRGRFVQPESGKALVEQMEEITSPVGAFVSERCERSLGAEVLVQELYEAWRKWCAESGKAWTSDAATFGRDLRAACPEIDVTRPRRDGRRDRYYVGIRLLD